MLVKSVGLHADLLESLDNDEGRRLLVGLQHQQHGSHVPKQWQNLMQAYRDLSTPASHFTLAKLCNLDFDPAAAVHRQHGFAVKMVDRAWLHGPNLDSLLDQARARYGNFFALLAAVPGPMVPTLDIDLVWHTHQLSPAKYAAFSKERANGRFIDHNDQVDEASLKLNSRDTATLYGQMFGLDYHLNIGREHRMPKGDNTMGQVREFGVDESCGTGPDCSSAEDADLGCHSNCDSNCNSPPEEALAVSCSNCGACSGGCRAAV